MAPLLTVKQLSQQLQVKLSTLYLWVAQGRIPAVKLNGLVRCDPAAIAQWVQSSKASSPVQLPRVLSTSIPQAQAVDALIARTKSQVYTDRGETRPTSSPIGKEETDGAV